MEIEKFKRAQEIIEQIESLDKVIERMPGDYITKRGEVQHIRLWYGNLEEPVEPIELPYDAWIAIIEILKQERNRLRIELQYL